MQEFKLFTDSNNQNEVLLILSTEDVYFLYEEIFKYFSIKKGVKFSIIVDLFLRNGFTFNRFVCLDFDGIDNVRSMIVNSRDVSEDIKMNINIFLKKNQDILKSSTLSIKAIEFVLSR